jgi:hypothetical protein
VHQYNKDSVLKEVKSETIRDRMMQFNEARNKVVKLEPRDDGFLAAVDVTSVGSWETIKRRPGSTTGALIADLVIGIGTYYAIDNYSSSENSTNESGRDTVNVDTTGNNNSVVIVK